MSDNKFIHLFIRNATKNDREELVLLFKELGYNISKRELESKLERFSSTKTDQVFVAVLNEEIVGVLSLHIMPFIHEPKHICRISAIVVRESFQGMGIGNQLMRKAEVYARECGCSRVEVTTRFQREKAQAFYKRLGYEATSYKFVKPLIV